MRFGAAALPTLNVSAVDSPAPSTPGPLRRGLGYELALYQQPKVFLAALALIFVPALYVLIYVSSVWDPYANLARLPGALVNQDLGDHRAGREINLGTQVAEKLEREKPFAFVRFATPATARAAVQQGQVFFALLIPPDFSRRALAAGQPAQLGLYVSEGNYTASLLTKRFATELAHQVNEQLGRERWSQLVGRGPPDAPTLAEGLDALRAGAWRVARGSATLHEGSRRLDQGLDRAAAGAKQIAAGTPKLAVASDQLTGGMKQVASAVDSIRAKLPADEKLRELAQGSEALVHGAGDLQTGLGQVREGTSRLETGAGQLQAGAAQVPFGGGKLSAGAGQLHTGAKTLGDGVARAAAGAGRLHEGQAQLNAAVQPLTAGLIELNGGLRTMREKLPAPAQLDLFNRSVGEVRDGAQALSTGLGELQAGSVRLTAGLGQLETGSGQLAAGLDEAAARFTTGFGGSLPSLLAAPVEPAIEVVAPVPHNGWAFAPYFASLSLWVGAVMMSFVFHLRRLPDPLRPAGRPTRWLVKAAPSWGWAPCRLPSWSGSCGSWACSLRIRWPCGWWPPPARSRSCA